MSNHLPIPSSTNPALNPFSPSPFPSKKKTTLADDDVLHYSSGNAFALFLKSQRKWENPPMQDEHRVLFKDFCAEHKYDSKRSVLGSPIQLHFLLNPYFQLNL